MTTAAAAQPNRRFRLFDEQEIEKIDNSHWLAEYTMKWLDSGLRLLEVKESKR